MTAVCPCCGQPVDPSRLIVDLNTNQATRNGVTARLSPRMSEILIVLNATWPGTVRHDRLLQRIYGADCGPEDTITIRVHMSKIRQLVRPLGVGIEARWGTGYRLVFDVKADPSRKRGDNRHWAPDEIKKLEHLVYVSGLSVVDASRQLGRSPGATTHKVRQIGRTRETGLAVA